MPEPGAIPPAVATQLDDAHYVARLDTIREQLAQSGWEGLLLLHPANVIWSTGFFFIPNERPLGLYIPVNAPATLFVPFLEKENAAASGLAVQHYWEYPGEELPELWMLRNIREERVALDQAGHALFQQLQALKPSLGLETAVFKLRYQKSDTELALIRQAAAYADFGLGVARRTLAEGVAVGVTELDVVEAVKSATVAQMRRDLDDLVNAFRGAVVLTVHTGPRAALPHGQPGPVAVKPGDTVIVGIGAQVGGYYAESGCTFVIGTPTAAQRRCLDVTWACNEAAVTALKPGATCESVDAAALAVLREAGYGDAIRHRIGHGIGIEGHEAPWLSVGDKTVLAPSMVFSNEPGIYRPGRDGYRIIDTMVVTPQGGRRLSRYLSEHGPDDRVIEA